MKTILICLFTVSISLGAEIDSMTDRLEVIIKDSQGNTTNGGSFVNHLQKRPAQVQAATDAYLAAKVITDKKKATSDAKILKDHGLAIKAETIEAVETWIITDAEDPAKAKDLKPVVPPAEGIGAILPQATKDKIADAK